jgi:hypothetical protein
MAAVLEFELPIAHPPTATATAAAAAAMDLVRFRENVGDYSFVVDANRVSIASGPNPSVKRA